MRHSDIGTIAPTSPADESPVSHAAAALGVEPVRAAGLTGDPAQRGQGEVAVVRAGVAEDQHRGTGADGSEVALGEQAERASVVGAPVPAGDPRVRTDVLDRVEHIAGRIEQAR